MKKLTKKQIINLVVDCICVILCILLLYTAISLLVNKREDGGSYVAWFGKLKLGIKTTSMDTPDGQESPYEIHFKKDDLVKVDVLNDEEIQQLKVGDVIAYWGDKEGDGTYEIITHRIIQEPDYDLTNNKLFRVKTKGDNPLDTNPKWVEAIEIIGKVVGVKEDGGRFRIWTSEPAGRFVLMVVPAILILGYVVVVFILTLTGHNKEKRAKDIDTMRAQMEEELRAKLAAELAAKAQEDTQNNNEQ